MRRTFGSATREPLSAFLEALWRNRLAALGGLLVATFALAAVLAPLLTPYGFDQMSYSESHTPPSLAHPFGTDFFGRDILTRVLFGIRISLLLSSVVVIINLVVGVGIGLVSGYSGGWLDNIFMRITDMFLSFPTLLFALSIMAVGGPGFWSLVLALTLKGWTDFARLTRSQVLTLKERDFVMAAHGLGARNLRIAVRHVLSNCLSTIFVYASLAITTPILAEAALSFLGLGLSPPTPSLGLMLASERTFMMRAWWAATFPGLAIMVLILGFNLLGDGVRDGLDPRTALSHRSPGTRRPRATP